MDATLVRVPVASRGPSRQANLLAALVRLILDGPRARAPTERSRARAPRAPSQLLLVVSFSLCSFHIANKATAPKEAPAAKPLSDASCAENRGFELHEASPKISPRIAFRVTGAKYNVADAHVVRIRPRHEVGGRAEDAPSSGSVRRRKAPPALSQAQD